MSAAHRFVADRGAIPITELGQWCGRGHAFIYRAIGRGELRMFGPGKVTADSVLDWYRNFNEGGGALEENEHSTSAPRSARGNKLISRKDNGGDADAADFSGGEA